jgi:hypothetical protein
MTTTPSPVGVRTGEHAATPFVAVTMGDGAGVGPEVVVGALVEPEIATLCRPVVIGDAQRLRAAAEILGVDAEIVTVESVEDAVFAPRRVNVIDLGLLPADLPWGKLSPVAGHAAYEYIRVASELAMEGRVQAICTAPLNKEALHAGGHVFPGHTELLAHLTGTEEVSMMLNSPRIRVIHVTTHIGLIDAVAKIEPGLVERTGAGTRRSSGPASRRPGSLSAASTRTPARTGCSATARRRRRSSRRSSGCRPTGSTPAGRCRPTPSSSSQAGATTTSSSRCTTTRATVRSRSSVSRRE